MKMQKAFAKLAVKSVDEDSRTIKGIATTATADRMGDIVKTDGVQFQLPMPLLWQHNHDQPIGEVTAANVGDGGIEITAQLAKGMTGKLGDRLDEAWQSIKSGLVKGLSIGFRPIKYAFMDDGGIEFSEWEWYELSAVTIPANAEATITNIKAMSKAATGSHGVSIRPKESTKMKSIAEQLAAYNDARAQKEKEMSDIMAKAGEDMTTLSAEQSEQYDTLSDEVDAIAKHISRLERMQAQQQKEAKSAKPAKAEAPAVPSAGVKIKNTQKLQPGIAFARAAKCLALGYLQHRDAVDISKSLYGDREDIVATTQQLVTKAAVAPATTGDDSWAGNLVGDETSTFADFVEFLRPQTILGKFGANGVPALRRVPFRVPLVGQTSGGDGYWVGEGKPKPLTKFDFTRSTLEPLKVANIAVLSMEVVRDSSPAADVIVRDQLAAALRARLDLDFIDPDKAASAGVSPASILNGLTPITSSGTDADAVRADLKKLFEVFIAANNTPTNGVWIMPSTVALSLSLMQNALGQNEFPNIGMNGGTFSGLPVIVSEYVPSDSSGAVVALVNASDIYIADDGDIDVSMSTEASLEMSDSPTGTASAAPTGKVVNLWQNNLIGFRAERTVNWMPRRSGASAAYLDGVNWA